MFLNNDTVVQKNWIFPLVSEIQANKKIGAIGPKLVYFSGKLQAAGCELRNDGWFHGIGKGESPKLGKYNKLSKTDSLYGACMLVKKSVFNEVGGFSEIYSPAYHEDIDLCLKIREKGYTLFYQPKSVVFHKEFASSNPNDAQLLLKKNHLQNGPTII